MCVRAPRSHGPVAVTCGAAVPGRERTRFGAPAMVGVSPEPAARAIPGNMDAPSVAPNPDASICKDFLRLIMVRVNYGHYGAHGYILSFSHPGTHS